MGQADHHFILHLLHISEWNCVRVHSLWLWGLVGFAHFLDEFLLGAVAVVVGSFYAISHWDLLLHTVRRDDSWLPLQTDWICPPIQHLPQKINVLRLLRILGLDNFKIKIIKRIWNFWRDNFTGRNNLSKSWLRLVL